MITDSEKDEIFNSLVVFYTSTYYNKSNLIYVFGANYDTAKDFSIRLYSENTRIFFRQCIRLQNDLFINHINNEFILYCIYNNASLEDKERWLTRTYKHIVPINELSGRINKSTVVQFVEWYNEIKKTITAQTVTEGKEKKLSINQIALKLVYEGASLPREKAKEIITDYGHTSGEALFNKFTKYSENNFRRNAKGTIKILENKIKLFESVIELLPDDKRSKAIDEVKYLKGFLVSLE